MTGNTKTRTYSKSKLKAHMLEIMRELELTALKHGQGKLPLPLTPDAFAQRLETIDRLTILSVDWATWLESVRLEWAHRDPAERCIVALARLKAASLVTSHEEIRRFYPEAIW